MQQKRVTTILVSVALILAFFFGVVTDRYLASSNRPPEISHTSQNSTSRPVSMMLDYGDGQVITLHNIQVAPGERLLDTLTRILKENNIELETKEYKGLGTLVNAIGKKKNGGEAGQYWQYWVNNKHADVGADQYIVQPTDVIEWKFIKSQQ